MYLKERGSAPMNDSRKLSLLAVVGAIVLFIGLFLQFFRLFWAPYIYLIGALCFGYAQFLTRYQGNNLTLRRLTSQQVLGIMALIFAGVLMIVMHRNEWIVCLAIGAFIELYTVFRIDYELKKEK